MTAPHTTDRHPPTQTRTFTGTFGEIVVQVRRTSAALNWISRAAWVLLAVGLVSLLAGRRLGWIELVVLGAGFLSCLLGAAIFAIGRHPYEIGLPLREGRIVVGERAKIGRAHV